MQLFALGEIKDTQAVEFLIKALRDKDMWVRRAAANSLSEIHDGTAIDSLINLLEEEDYYLVRNAKEALIKINKPAIKPLITYLKISEHKGRRYAVQALGEIKDTQVINSLIAALKDDDFQVQRQAAMALGHIKDKKQSFLLLKLLGMNILKFDKRQHGH